MPVAYNKILLTNKKAVATPLLAISIDQFGTECFEWEPEILNDELESYAGSSLPKTNKDKVQALMLGIQDERVWNDTLIFSYVANTIGGEDIPIVPGSMDMASPYEIAWTVVELLLNDPPEDDLKDRLGRDIQKLIQYWFNSSGLKLPPSPFEWMDVETDEVESLASGMFGEQASYQHYNNLKEDVEQYVTDRFTIMIDQLQKITLNVGDTSNLELLEE